MTGNDPLRDWAAALAPRWRPPVSRALDSRDRFATIVAGVHPGPTRDWLLGLQPTIDLAVQRVADTVWRAIGAESLAATLDSDTATAELKAARRELEVRRAAGGDVSADEERVEALAERHRAVHDALNLAEGTSAQLDLLNTRLDTAVARAATVVLRSTVDSTDRDALTRELDEVIGGLGALESALASFGPG